MGNRTIRAAVFDIDGTLAMMDKDKGSYIALPGAIEALASCRASGRPAVAYTNGTFFPPEHYYPLLAAAGLHLDPGHILTPGAVAAHVLKKKGYRRIMVLGADGTRLPLAQAGIEVVEPRPEAGVVDAIMLGWTKDFGARDVEALCTTIWDHGVPVYAASVAPYFASAKGRMLGISGAVAAMVEYTTGSRATVLGKPSAFGLEMIADLTGASPEEMIVIGDDPKLEIRMARRADALAVGVTTGIVDAAGFLAAPQDERAQFVIGSLEGLAAQEWFQ